MKRLLTKDDLCALFCCSESTVYRRIKSGEWQSVNRRGQKLLFDPDTVEAWIKSRQQVVPISTPHITNGAKQQQREQEQWKTRQVRAAAALDRHRTK